MTVPLPIHFRERYDHQADERDTNQLDVLLISMPFAQLSLPSIGLSLLRQALVLQGISAEILYTTFAFAERIGVSLYSQLADGSPVSHDLCGEWIFSHALYQQSDADVSAYINDVLRGGNAIQAGDRLFGLEMVEFVNEVCAARNQVEDFLERCLQQILISNPRIIGFTSVFQQQLASLALAKRVKEACPDTFIVFGGANCEGAMGREVLRQFAFVDAIVSGEGEQIFPALVHRVFEAKSLEGLPGVTLHSPQSTELTLPKGGNAPIIRNMDSLPLPDYDDYFAQMEAHHFDSEFNPKILFETSRGCWWGEKSHCTFCGLNGESMLYRSKSSQRAMDELLCLAAKYPGRRILAVDNILDLRYFKDFIPSLASKSLSLELFYEVKANLRKDQVQLLCDAGITRIQPGIESLSDEVLRLMGKGVKGLQNIQLLKWCKEIGIEAVWNFLWGFPGESPEEYDRMAEMIPLITHLYPPGSCSSFRLDRFSPNFNRADELGFVDVKPYPAYHFVYPLPPEVLANLAYYFTYEYQEPRNVISYTNALAQELRKWRQYYDESDCFWIDREQYLLLCDFRPIATRPLRVLMGLHRLLYMACDQMQTPLQLQELCDSTLDIDLLRQTLEMFVAEGLMLKGGDYYLSLALPMGRYSPAKAILDKLMSALQALETGSGEAHVAATVT